MSSRRETEKRLRPRNDPYKRNHFNKSQYLRISVPAHTSDSIDSSEIVSENVDYEDDDDGGYED